MTDTFKDYREDAHIDKFFESLRKDVDMLLNEAYNIGRLEGYYEGLSEGSDRK